MTEFDKVIPPGGVGKVTASLDTAHYKGSLAKSVQVRTNDPKTPPVTLLLKADVVTLIDVTPTDTPMLRTTVGDPKPMELTVLATDRKPFDVLTVQADPSVAVTVRPAPGAPPATRKPKRSHRRPVAAGTNRYLLTITPRADAPIGQSIANVTLTTDRARAETVSIRAIVVAVGPVQISPAQIIMFPGLEAVPHVKITKASGGAFRILAVESSNPQFTPTVTTTTEGREYDLTVKYTGKPGRGLVSSRITVKTNEPGQDTIVIPLTGQL